MTNKELVNKVLGTHKVIDLSSGNEYSPDKMFKHSKYISNDFTHLLLGAYLYGNKGKRYGISIGNGKCVDYSTGKPEIKDIDSENYWEKWCIINGIEYKNGDINYKLTEIKKEPTKKSWLILVIEFILSLIGKRGE